MNPLLEYFPIANAWLVPGIPLISAALVLLVLRPLSARLAGWFATSAVLVSCVIAWAIAYRYLSAETAEALVPSNFNWLQYQSGLAVHMGVLLDPLSILLMVVVTTVSFLVHVYSLGYLKGEIGFGRYFGVLNFFTGAMLGLVVSTNLIQTYVFWELVGVSSFLLIGYYYDRPAAVAASKKAFIVTRFADLGFFLGILLVAYLTVVVAPIGDPLEFKTLTGASALAQLKALPTLAFGIAPLTLAAFLIFMGAAGKSAMFPLHIWLPDAMEGPTPVSALIHAATMVVAGIYLVARLYPLFAAAGPVLDFVAFIGAFTCLFAALIAATQDDIKRVLAFSTLSQIGYMMLALGVNGYGASLFHLTTHAFFKALLFLGAGSVIHAVHSNDIWKMGGLARKMPVTHITFLLAVLAIAGIPPFAGFFSKDAILLAALSSGHFMVFGVALCVAGLTAFYMARVYFVVFWGASRDAHAAPHESPALMCAPLLVLALLSLASGFVPIEHWLGAEAESVNRNVAFAGTMFGAAGIFMAWVLFGREREVGPSRSGNPLYRVIKNKFYVDEAYLWVTRRVLFGKVAAPIAWFDRNVVDGAVNLAGRLVEVAGRGLGFTETGQVQTYGTWLVSATAAVVIIFWGILQWA